MGHEDAQHLSWDDPDHRERILRSELPATWLWVFDELHKYRRWRNYLKGLHDTRPTSRQILVTGSAKLDFYRWREVDFVVTDGRTPALMVECKLSESPVDRGLRYLKVRFPACPAWQLHAEGTRDFETPEGIRVAPALTFLKTLV